MQKYDLPIDIPKTCSKLLLHNLSISNTGSGFSPMLELLSTSSLEGIKQKINDR